MGQVYTWEAVRSGHIPRKENFEQVRRFLTATLADEPSVVFAIVLGSLMHSDATLRSDVDCVVLYKTEKERVAMEVLNGIGHEAQKFHIVIDFTTCDTAQAKTVHHNFSSDFLMHLQVAMNTGGLVKGSLEGYFPQTLTHKQSVENWLMWKISKMRDGLAEQSCMDEEAMARFLTKAIEAPVHAARKVLVHQDVVLENDSKQEVLERYSGVMPEFYSANLDDLVRADRSYTERLYEQLAKPDAASYAAAVQYLRRQAPAILSFLRDNLSYISSPTKARQR